jgi:hypothetical protein
MKKMIMVGVLALGMQVQAQALWQPSERLVQWEPSWNSILNQEGYSAKKKGGVTKSKGGVKSSSKSSFSGASFGNNTIRANIGLGPSWNNFVGRISEDHFRMGLAIDAYLVTPPAVVKEERKKIDPRFRNLLQQTKK